MEIERFTMIYETKKKEKDKLRILGDVFVKKNKNKGRLIIKNKKYYLTSFLSIKDINEDKLKIGLVYDKNIYIKGYTFKDCEELIQCSFHDYNDNNDIFESLENNLQNEIKIENDIEIKEDEEMIQYWDYAFEEDDSPLKKDIWDYSLFCSPDISKIGKTFEYESKISNLNYNSNSLQINYNMLKYMF